jgi:SAM-dependent methyltransferase
MAVDPFDPAEFKERQRAAGGLVSATLVELARIVPGASVLDVGGGHGEPSLAAAAAVGSEGTVVCTDLSADMLTFARERASAGRARQRRVRRAGRRAARLRAGELRRGDQPRDIDAPPRRNRHAARLAELVSSAGFRDVRTEMVSAAFETDTPDEFTQFLRDVAPPITRLVADQPPTCTSTCGHV